MTFNKIGRSVEILLVEDNPGDIDLTKEAFLEGKVFTNLSVAEDGAEALAFLRKEGKYVDAPHPDLILLDLNLPNIDGFEVLSIIKKDKELRRIPVIVLTTSNADKDIVKSYDLYANSYITKPIDIDDFIIAMRSIEQFWLTFVKFPCKDGT